MIQHFDMNKQGRDFVVGDIHGCFTKLQKALDALDFHPEVDRLFSVGDLVDRGPESADYWDWYRLPWFHAVRGNHEQMVIDAMEDPKGNAAGHHYMNGGAWLYAMPEVEAQCHAQIMADMPFALEVETPTGLVGIVHAEVPFGDWDLFKTSIDGNEEMFQAVCMWARTKISTGNKQLVKGIDRVYVGHTVVDVPVQLGNVHYIDLGACFGRELCIVQIN